MNAVAKEIQPAATPETDALMAEPADEIDVAEFARKLELERDAARREAAELRAALKRAMPAIRGYAAMVQRSTGSHSERSAHAGNLIHEARALLVRVRHAD